MAELIDTTSNVTSTVLKSDQTAPTMAPQLQTDTSAAERVFGITELAEMILLRTPRLKDIFALMQTSKSLCATAKNSTQLHRSLTYLQGDRLYHLTNQIDPMPRPCRWMPAFKQFIYFVGPAQLKRRNCRMTEISPVTCCRPVNDLGQPMSTKGRPILYIKMCCYTPTAKLNYANHTSINVKEPHDNELWRSIRISLPGVDVGGQKECLETGRRLRKFFPGGSTLGVFCDWLYEEESDESGCEIGKGGWGFPLS